MYINEDNYSCDICGAIIKWDATDEIKGTMWECEDCGIHFCTKCFIEKLGEKSFNDMMKNDSIVRCPNCFKAIEETLNEGKM